MGIILHRVHWRIKTIDLFHDLDHLSRSSVNMWYQAERLLYMRLHFLVMQQYAAPWDPEQDKDRV